MWAEEKNAIDRIPRRTSGFLLRPDKPNALSRNAKRNIDTPSPPRDMRNGGMEREESQGEEFRQTTIFALLSFLLLA